MIKKSHSAGTEQKPQNQWMFNVKSHTGGNECIHITLYMLKLKMDQKTPNEKCVSDPNK